MDSVTLPYAGRFVWRELNTPDPHSALKFYESLFGWRFEAMDPAADEPYRVIFMNENDIGGISPRSELPDAGSYWKSYITVNDVDAACEQAILFGATVDIPPTDIPQTGRFAVLRDSGNARFSPFCASSVPSRLGRPPIGTFCWTQLLTHRLAEVLALYRSLFGWTMAPMNTPAGESVILSWADEPIASILAKPPGQEGPDLWLPYIAVENCAKSELRAKQLGAQVYVPSTEMPPMGTFSVLADPTGSMFALWQDHSSPG